MQDSEISYYPFFDIRSKLLKDMLGVKDNRSVIRRITEIGAPIHRKGKSRYVLTFEILQAIKAQEYVGYSGKSPLSKL